MHKQNGFTVLELVITMVMIGILLAVGIVSYRSTLVASRDRERAGDVETIAEYLEAIYPKEILSGSTVIKKAGTYPATIVVNNSGYYTAALEDLPRSAVLSPGSTTTSFIGATVIIPTTSISQYNYVPLQSSDTLCTSITQECRRFIIYYTKESGDTTTKGSVRR